MTDGRATWVLLFILSALVHTVCLSKLCPGEHQWYDADTGKCNICEPCGTKALELEPCSEFRNTLCVDLNSFRFDFKGKAPHLASTSQEKVKVEQVPRHRWHEMETDDDPPQVLTAAVARLSQESNPTEPVMWGAAVVVVLCVALAATFCAMVVLLGKHVRRAYVFHQDNRRVAARARLFSRDRLNTTEYMHNLATLDRRLAMDEILEKRKKAIFEPQLLCENVYTDDVFVDISGFPPDQVSGGAVGKDQEHRQSLLSTEERQ